MTLSGLLYWLTSQSIFLVRVDIWEPFGREVSRTISTVGYSCIATIFALSLGVLALVTALGMGYKQFAADITTVGSCSVAITAACHASGADCEEIVEKKVRWGDVEIVQSLGKSVRDNVRHLTKQNHEHFCLGNHENFRLGTVSNLRVRHLTFSSEEGVRKPEFEVVYAGVRRMKE